MSGVADRLKAAVSDPHRRRVTVRADDVRWLLFAAGFSDHTPEEMPAGQSLHILEAANLPPRQFTPKDPHPCK